MYIFTPVFFCMNRLRKLLPLLLLAACNSRQPADLVVHHAHIYTVDSAFSTAEAMAIKDGKVLATGTDATILAHYNAAQVVDARGQAVYPGLIDAHAHFVGYGRALYEVALYDCADWQQVVARVEEFATQHPNETWIRGRGWDQNKWPGKALPDNSELNRLFPGKPVLLDRVDGHAAVANAAALKLAGVTAGTTIAGGVVGKTNGIPNGLLIDNAVALVTKVVPAPTAADYEKWLLAAQRNCFAQGLTTVTDCGLNYTDIYAIDSLQKQGKLLMNMYVMLSDDTANFARFLQQPPYKTERLYVKGVKAYADGALGSRGACLLAPYGDQPGWQGFLLAGRGHYDSLAAMLVHTGYQLCTHAIGDSGNRMVLQVYDRYLHGHNDKRWRIEHAQVVNPDDLQLFGRNSIVPSVQPTHATSDMYWAGERLGAERLKTAYAYRQLLEQNGWLPLGTDFPVEDISPFKTFYAAVVRKDAKGYPEGGFQKENALTRGQALRGMTIWAARAGCLDKEIGSLEPGKKADFVILDRDLMMAADTALLQTHVIATYSRGKSVH